MPSSSVLVLAPHHDDGPLSVGGLVQRDPRRFVFLTVFSRSAFTSAEGNRPRRAAAVTRLRAAEERAAARALGRVRVGELGLKEACLRGFSVERLFFLWSGKNPKPPRGLLRGVDEALRRVAPRLVLSPLGLGLHLDHQMVSRAALTSCQALALPLGFYEDLPYAASLSLPAVRAHVRRLFGSARAVRMRVPLSRQALQVKLDALCAYRSQLSQEDLLRVAWHALRRGTAEERLWVRAEDRAALRALAKLGAKAG